MRLLDLGYPPHDVLHMLGFAAMGPVLDALENDESIDPAAYREALDALPDTWLDQENDAGVFDDDYARTSVRGWTTSSALLHEGTTDAAKLLERLGLGDRSTVDELAKFLHWHADFAHVLPDGRVAHEADLLDGVVLLHRITPSERAAQRLDLGDLHLLLALPDRQEGLPLPTGGTATISLRRGLDGPAATMLDDAAATWTLDGRTAGSTHTRRRGRRGVVAQRTLHVEASDIDGAAADEAASALARAVEARLAGDPDLSYLEGGVLDVTDALLDVLLFEPDALRRPTAPLSSSSSAPCCRATATTSRRVLTSTGTSAIANSRPRACSGPFATPISTRRPNRSRSG